MLAYNGNKILTFYDKAKQCLSGGLCFPRTALIYPSRLCNQNCYFCSDKVTNKQLKNIFMDRDLLASLPNQVADLGCEAVELCGGGEPFTHPDLPEFIENCLYYNLKLGSLTNGTLLKGKLADLVVDTFSFIRISLDSFNPQTYSSVRGASLKGNNSLEQVLKNIKYLVRRKKEMGSKILITVKAVFDKNTLCELSQFINESRELGVDGINIKSVRNVKEQLDVNSIPQYYVDFLEREKGKNKEGEPWVFGNFNNSVIETFDCFACNFHVFIDTDGSLRLCCYYQNRPKEHTYGKLKVDNLRELWTSIEHRKAVSSIDVTKCNLYNCKYHNFNNLLSKGIVEDEGQWQFT